MGQTGHENDAGFLAQTLNGNGHARGRTAIDHDDAVLFDHRTGSGAGGVGLGLRVTSHELDLLAKNAIPLQRLGAEGVQHAAVALAIEVLDSKLLGTQFVQAFSGIRTSLRHVESELCRAAGRLIEIFGSNAPAEHGRDKAGANCASSGTLEHRTPGQTRFAFAHGYPPR